MGINCLLLFNLFGANMKTIKYDDRIETFNDKGELHSFRDKPAMEFDNGLKGWYKEGKLHRLDGPAIESNWSKIWFYEGKEIECNSIEEFLKIIYLKAFW